LSKVHRRPPGGPAGEKAVQNRRLKNFMLTQEIFHCKEKMSRGRSPDPGAEIEDGFCPANLIKEPDSRLSRGRRWTLFHALGGGR